MTTPQTAPLDQKVSAAFAERLIDILNSGAIASMLASMGNGQR